MYTFKGGNSFLEVNDHIIQFPIAFDFIHSENLDTTKEILLFKRNNKYDILLPTFSEGFTTFTLLEFSQDGTYKYLGNHTYNNDIFNKIKNTPPEKRIYFLKQGKTKTPGIYVKQGNNDLLFSEISYPEPDPIANEEIEKINFYKKGGSSQNLKTYPSDLKGMWGVICENELTVLKINKNEGFLSLYDFNAIYINLKVEKSSNKKEYLLKYASVASQEDYYKENLKIIDDEISKDKVIGKLILQNSGKAELQWIGLYNMKKQKLEFVGNDFLLIKENGGKTPLILEPCK
ncbi:hypothetical protein [Chryseobacterium jejuense]|uniref:hypothetical protein n=1 Tax=Chryseobacterium jejuense TaxID=445960 RepID=UPI001AEA9D0D|nr:hypothetical protein [Chryseobacterium jejuense]MBP2619058.1 hypothetical protein [Chryseobacterium jejuense]